MQDFVQVVNKHPLAILMMAVIIGVLLLFGPVILFPNQYLLSHAGDGLKAYYATSYYLLHGGGLYHHGFMYPNGIHLVYMDMNPLLTGVLKLIQQVFNIEPFTVGIINYTVILGFFPCAYFVYKILRQSMIPPIWAVFFALIITFMSPQIKRITGHYSLTYYFYIPLLWLIILRVFSGPKKWLWIYSGVVLLFSLAHPYHFLLGASFLLAYGFVYFLQHRKEGNKEIPFYLGVLAAGLAPGIIIKLWEIITTIGPTDFVKYPFGFIQYRAGFESIFLPREKPLISLWDSLIKIRRFGIEGYAYVGFIGLLALAATVRRIYIHLRKKKGYRIIHPVLPSTLHTTIWAATLLLIPAFVYPFQFWPDALEWFPFIRQFRSMGRLAWVFYYVFMVYSVVWVYKVYRARKIHHQDKFATGFLIFVCFFWLFETGVYHWHERNKFLPNRIENYSERRMDFQRALEDNGYHSSDFQAIIGLPYFHIGSEKLQFSHWEASRLSMAVSQQTGLPMTNFMAARTPLTSSLASIQLGASPLIDKTLVENLPNDKPFLLLYFKGDFSPGERRLIARSKQITSIGNFGLASLPLSAFNSSVETEIEKFEAGKDRLIPTGNQLFADHQTNGVYLETFGDHPAILGGESRFVKKGRVTLFDGTIHTRWENMVMELSFWVKLDQESNYLPRMELSMFRNGELLEKQNHFMLETKDVYKGWARVRAEFMLKNPSDRILVETTVEKLTVDNIMIKPVGINLYSWRDDVDCIFMNNYFLCR